MPRLINTDDLRAKLERVEAYLKHDVPTLTGRLFWAYGPTNENDERTSTSPSVGGGE